MALRSKGTKKPAKKPLLWLAGILLVLGVLGAGGENTETSNPPLNETIVASANITQATADDAVEPNKIVNLPEYPSKVVLDVDTFSEKSIEESDPSEPIGTDYVLNANTKKFHYTYCSSVDQMKEKNKRFYTGTREEVIAKGYEPCGRCHP